MNLIKTSVLTVAYDDNSEKFFSDLTKMVESKYPFVDLIGYHEQMFKERSKAFKVKGGWSARICPFAVLTDLEKTPIKAFYSEANECTVDNISKILDSFITYKSNENASTSN